MQFLAKKRLPMKVPAPHYLLYSQSRTSGQHSSSGNWRFVLEAADGTARLEAADDEAATAERLELMAIVRGLEALDQPSRVTLVTGSRYVSRGIQFGLSQWRESDWQWERYGEMSPIKDRDLWQRVDQALQFHHVECRTPRLDGHDDLQAPVLRLVPSAATSESGELREPVRITRPRKRHRGNTLRFDRGASASRIPAVPAESWVRRLWTGFRRFLGRLRAYAAPGRKLPRHVMR